MKHTLLIITALLFITSTVIPQSKVNINNLVEYGGKMFKQDNYTAKRIGGVQPFEAIVEVRRGEETADSAMLLDPKVMKQVGKLQTFIGTIPEIGKSVSYVDYFREMHRSWHDGDSAYYVLPDTRAEIEQILIIFSTEQPDSIFAGLVDTSLENYFSRARIFARTQDVDLRGVDSERAREITGEIQTWADENFGDSISVIISILVKPYTGRVFDLYNSTDEKMLDGRYRNGLKNSKWTHWYENGQKSWEGNYKDGEEVGKWTYWSPDGKESSELICQDGNPLDGKLTEWYDNGQKRLEIIYLYGALIKGTCWNPNGNKWDCTSWISRTIVPGVGWE